MTPGSLVPGVHRIAVLRANGVGDLVFSLPALSALKATYPEAELVLLGAPWHAAFLPGRPGPVDRVEVIPPLPGLRGGDAEPGEVEAWEQRMRDEDWDLALQWHGGGRHSNPLVLGLGARVTSGSHTPDAPQLARSVTYVYFQHEVVRYLELARLVGVRAPIVDPVLALTEADRAEAATLGLARRRYVVLHPGATDARRRWPAERFARVGDGLHAAGHEVLVTGTEPERAAVEEVLRAMRAPARTVVDTISLGGLAGLLAGASLVVSNDSGPLHLAHAVGARTVGIFWSYNLGSAPPFFRDRHRPLASFRMCCPGCGAQLNDCDHRISWVSEIEAEPVLAVARDLLGLPVEDERALVAGLDLRAP